VTRPIRFACLALALTAAAMAQDAAEIALPAPHTTGGKPLLQALRERKSSRAFAPDALPLATLSDLLWAAAGVNRDDGHRTFPTANNKQEIEVYAVLRQGVYLYDPKAHRLARVAAGDLRAGAGGQDFVAGAPLNLVYVTDYSKTPAESRARWPIFSAAAVGAISQNVYLFCASQGLAAVVRASVNGKALAEPLRLGPDREVVLAQTVGLPAK
jgi:SagB-type dehydrogenase family enzyme